LLSF
jgi:hypothetical protein